MQTENRADSVRRRGMPLSFKGQNTKFSKLIPSRSTEDVERPVSKRNDKFCINCNNQSLKGKGNDCEGGHLIILIL
jgi:hypothetical protein